MALFQCDTCKGFNTELIEYWRVHHNLDGIAAWHLCPKCAGRQIKPPMTEAQAHLELITRKLLNEQ